MGLGRYHKHTNIMCDHCFKDTLKDQTQIDRGIGTEIDFDNDTPFPSDFRSDFIDNNENKNAQ